MDGDDRVQSDTYHKKTVTALPCRCCSECYDRMERSIFLSGFDGAGENDSRGCI